MVGLGVHLNKARNPKNQALSSRVNIIMHIEVGIDRYLIVVGSTFQGVSCVKVRIWSQTRGNFEIT